MSIKWYIDTFFIKYSWSDDKLSKHTRRGRTTMKLGASTEKIDCNTYHNKVMIKLWNICSSKEWLVSERSMKNVRRRMVPSLTWYLRLYNKICFLAPIGGMIRFARWHSICHGQLRKSIWVKGQVLFKILQFLTRPMERGFSSSRYQSFVGLHSP